MARTKGTTTTVKKPKGSTQNYRRGEQDPTPKKAGHRLKTPAGKKIPNASKKRLTAALTAEAAIALQLKGIKANDTSVEPYMLKVSDVVKGMKLPTYPSPDIIRAMAHLVRQGNFPAVAARAVGVSNALFETWVLKGFEDPSSVYGMMISALDIADAQDEISDLQLITAGVRSWAALAWKRGRKSEKRWGDKGRGQAHDLESYGAPVLEAKFRPVPDGNTSVTILQTLEQIGALSILKVAQDMGVDPSLMNPEGANDDDAEE